jgi:hypothetical protein
LEGSLKSASALSLPLALKWAIAFLPLLSPVQQCHDPLLLKTRRIQQQSSEMPLSLIRFFHVSLPIFDIHIGSRCCRVVTGTIMTGRIAAQYRVSEKFLLQEIVESV